MLPEVCDVADRLLDKWTAIANHGQGNSSNHTYIVLFQECTSSCSYTVLEYKLIVASAVLQTSTLTLSQ
jgi:hypothetical protein